MIFGKLLPREGNFFALFNQHAEHTRDGRSRFCGHGQTLC
jgi:hypothetical protein